MVKHEWKVDISKRGTIKRLC